MNYRFPASIPISQRLPYWKIVRERWQSLFNWFVGENDNNEVNRLFEITNEIIRKITRYALQIGELHNQGQTVRRNTGV